MGNEVGRQGLGRHPFIIPSACPGWVNPAGDTFVYWGEMVWLEQSGISQSIAKEEV